MKMSDVFGVGTVLAGFGIRAIVDRIAPESPPHTDAARRPDNLRLPAVPLPAFWIVHGR